MKSLAERHADRAQRKADGLEFSDNTGGDLALAALRIGEAQAAIDNLSPEEREELRNLVGNDGFDTGNENVYGDAYDARGSLKTAGVGVVNTLVAPVAAAMFAETTAGPVGGMDGNGDGFASGDAAPASGWGNLPDPSVTRAEGNPDGAAVEAAPGAEGATATEGNPKPAKGGKGAAKPAEGQGE